MFIRNIRGLSGETRKSLLMGALVIVDSLLLYMNFIRTKDVKVMTVKNWRQQFAICFLAKSEMGRLTTHVSSLHTKITL